MKKRIDGKKSNAAKDPLLVSTVKTLVEHGLPPKIISAIFKIRESTISQYRTSDRQANVPALPLGQAKAILFGHLEDAFKVVEDNQDSEQQAA